MKKNLKRQTRQALAALLTAAMTVSNIGGNLGSVLGATTTDTETESLFLVDLDELKSAIRDAAEDSEALDYAKLELAAENEKTEKAYAELLEGDSVYELELDMDDSYAADNTELNVYYNKDEDKVIFFFVNENDYAVSMRANIGGYETESLVVSASDLEEDTELEAAVPTETVEATEAPTEGDPEIVIDVEQPEASEEETAGTDDVTEDVTIEKDSEDEASDGAAADDEQADTEKSDGAEAGSGAEDSANTDTSDNAGVSGDAADSDHAGTSDGGDKDSESADKADTGSAEGGASSDSADNAGSDKSDAGSDKSDSSEKSDSAGSSDSGKSDSGSSDKGSSDSGSSDSGSSDDGSSDSGASDGGDLSASISLHEIARVAASNMEKATASNAAGSDDLILDEDTENDEIEDEDVEVLGTLEGTTLNGVTLWDTTSARAYEVEAKDVLGLEAADMVKKTASVNGVTFTATWDPEIIPATAELEVREITGEAKTAIADGIAASEDGVQGVVTDVVAYDITLVNNGEVLANDWSDAGSGVHISITGSVIEEKTKEATAVQIVHVDTADGTAVEEATADQLIIDPEDLPEIDVTDTSVEEVSFDAQHFSVYAIAFVNGETTEATVNVVQTVLGNETLDMTEGGSLPVALDSSKEVEIAEFIREKEELASYTVDTKTYSYSYATVTGAQDSDKVEKLRVSGGQLQYLDSETWMELTEGTVYLWYTDKVARIGEREYETLDLAIAAANETDVIELLADDKIFVNTISKPITINGNGKLVTVPKQNTETGAFQINGNGKLIFKNTKVNFNNPGNWSVSMGSDATAEGLELSFLDGSKAEFVSGAGGIYSEPDSNVNVENSELIFTDLAYNAFMGGKTGEYINLNVKNSVFSVNGTRTGNGLNWVKADVKDSTFTIKGAYNQASVTCSFTFDNSTVNVSDCNYGFNSNKELNIINGSKVMIEDIGRCGVYYYDFTAYSVYSGTTAGTGGQSMRVDSTSTLEITNCGTRWNTVAESSAQAYSAAIAMLSGNATCTFEDGANVNIHNNAVRAFLNEGNIEFGKGTVIQNNGSKVSVGGAILNEDSRGAGNVTIHSGAVITNNEAKIYGGAISNGIYYNAAKNLYTPYDGNVTMEPGVVLYNNHAGLAGDDLYNAGTTGYESVITLGTVGFDWILDDCDHLITGWFDDAEGNRWEAHKGPTHTDEYEVDGTTTLEGTIVTALKAAHGLPYAVDYDLQGGTYNGNSTIDQEKYFEGEKVTVKDDPIRDGYTFAGWTISTNDQNVSAPEVAGQVFTMPGANVLLTAKWEKLYTVDYNLNGGTYEGSTTVPQKKYEEGTPVTVISTPIRTDYVFTGWTVTADDTTVTVPTITDRIFTMPGANVLLTANWKPADTEYTVTHIYMTTTNTYDASGTLTSTETVQGASVTDAARGGSIGDVINPSDLYVTSYNEKTYTVSSSSGSITLVADPASNVITITYNQIVENRPDNGGTTTPTNPSSGSSNHHGGGSSSSGPSSSATTTTGGPGAQTTTITAEDVPLAALPENTQGDPLLTIPEEEVPLAGLPKTGHTDQNGLTLLLSGLMLAALLITGKKKEEQ